MSLLAAAILGVLVLLPLIWLAGLAFTGAGTVTAQHFQEAFGDALTRKAVVNSIILSAGVAIGAALLGVPLAWAVSRTNMPFGNAVRYVAVATFVIPPYLTASAWILLGGPNAGRINVLLRSLTGTDITLFNVFSLPGLIFVMSLYAYPLVFLPVANALSELPGELEESSQTLGAGRLRTFFCVTLPLVLPAVAAGVTLAFLEAISEFGAPAVLGIPAGVTVITTRLVAYLQYPPELQLAAAVSLPSIGFVVILLYIQRRLLGKRGYGVVSGGPGSGARKVRFTGWRRWLILSLVLPVPVASLALPGLTLASAAFSKAWGRGLTRENITLENFRTTLGGSSGAMQALAHSVELAVGAATIATVLGLLLAYSARRQLLIGARFHSTVAVIPYALPGVVLGIGLFAAYTHAPIQLYGTLFVIVLAYVTRTLPLTFTVTAAGLQQINADLELAARTLGASGARAATGITLPLLGLSLISSWILAFMPSLSEFSASVVLATGQTQVASTYIYNLEAEGRFEEVAALGVCMVIITLVAFLLLQVARSYVKVRRD